MIVSPTCACCRLSRLKQRRCGRSSRSYRAHHGRGARDVHVRRPLAARWPERRAARLCPPRAASWRYPLLVSAALPGRKSCGCRAACSWRHGRDVPHACSVPRRPSVLRGRGIGEAHAAQERPCFVLDKVEGGGLGAGTGDPLHFLCPWLHAMKLLCVGVCAPQLRMRWAYLNSCHTLGRVHEYVGACLHVCVYGGAAVCEWCWRAALTEGCFGWSDGVSLVLVVCTDPALLPASATLTLYHRDRDTPTSARPWPWPGVNRPPNTPTLLITHRRSHSIFEQAPHRRMAGHAALHTIRTMLQAPFPPAWRCEQWEQPDSATDHASACPQLLCSRSS